MQLIIDPDNYLSLKPLLALRVLNLCDVQITKRKTDVDDYLIFTNPPLLELDDESVLFSPNVIASYLMVKKNENLDDMKLDGWLEWESSYLEPHSLKILTHIYHSTKVDSTILDGFSKCLQTLEETISTKNFICLNEITQADIVIWSTIYPFLTDKKLSELYLKSYDNIQRWFNGLWTLESFKSTLETHFKGKYMDVLKKSVCAMPLPLLPKDVAAKVSREDSKTVTRQTSSEKRISEAAEEDHELTFSPQEVSAVYESWLHGRQNAPPPREIIHPIYCRLRNYNTLYICGTDEYGTATETKAIEEGLTPKEICDKYHKLHSEIYEWFEISFDYFGRTTTQQQTQISQEIFWRLHRNGHLIEDSTNQLLCEKCCRFLADRFVEGTCPLCGYEDARGDQCDACGKLINAIELKSPRCKLCLTQPVVKSSNHLFINLPQLEDKLQKWFEKASEAGIWTTNAKMIVNSWLKEGLKPRCITRDLKWGTPVPLEGFTDKVFYVWFDAPIGYFSITANYTSEWEKWWKNPKQVQLYQFMAKDNVPFHGLIFPSTEIGADDNYTIVNHLIATEYLNYEDGKFSKSRGVGVFGDQAKDVGIPADIWRFYLLYTRPETQDSAFCWSDLMLKNNSELLNNLGNFINRCLTFLSNNFDGVIPEMNLNEDDKLFLAFTTHQLNGYLDALERARLREAVRNILNISRRGNQLIQNNKPWVLIKGDADDKFAGRPYMPKMSRTIQEQLAAPVECNVLLTSIVCYLPAGHKIGKPVPLFQKLEIQRIEELKKQFAGKSASRETTPPVPPERKIANSIIQDGHILNCVQKLSPDELKEAIASQGNIVRQLKAVKGDKKKIDEEVAKLLNLKRQLQVIG
uniref:Methionine--tRNA ligase, cytoplasmic n=1 Tax=Strigamia maritima TaxID=126957 RepID=T1JAR2_STRMM